jgi:methylated-DNA-[protein]-cysteine S-methyltransferase
MMRSIAVGPAAEGASEPLEVSAVDTPFGVLFAAGRDGVILATAGPREGPSDPVTWGRWQWPECSVRAAPSSHAELHKQVREYFAGRRRSFDVPVLLQGSQLAVLSWTAALEIPYARTLTYGEVALEIGAPGAARAVGRAMAVCPLPLLVPCHRVVGAGGRRCGAEESWRRRQSLLDFERGVEEP